MPAMTPLRTIGKIIAKIMIENKLRSENYCKK